MRFTSPLLLLGAGVLLASCGGGNSNTANPELTVSLSASQTALAAGDSATLTWSSTDANACSASGAWSGTLSTSGTQSTGALSDDATYTLTCTGAGNTSKAATVTITVNDPPTAALTASPISVAAGGASELTWSSTNATSCAASGAWSGALAAGGTQSTGPLTATSTFSLTCAGAGGTSAVASAEVTVTTGSAASAPTVHLSASPTAVAAGGTATLRWSSTNAAACTASGAWSGTLASSGSRSTSALNATTVYTIECTGPGGTTAPASATVKILPVPTATLTATPTAVAAGSASTLNWSSTNATACTASGGWTGTLPVSGTRSTGALEATTSYSLTCSGAGGTSHPVSATVSLSAGGTVTLAPPIAAITLTRTQQFTATVAGGGGASWTVDGIAGGNSTVGVISATGLYTAGTAGTHTIVAKSVADPSRMASAVAAVTDLPGVYTYHNDLARDGANTQEYALTRGNVNTANFGKVASCAVDGAVYAQPLWVANVTLSGVKHNVVFVATEHDGLFAFDGDSSACTKLWSISLIDSAHGATGGEITVPITGDLQPEIGVTGTPVIDPSTGILYVVSQSVSSAQTTFYQRLHAIDITTGKEKAGSPVNIAGTYPGTGDGGSTVVFSAKQELERAGLAFVNDVVYIAWSSYEDHIPWYGWVMGYRYTGTAPTQTAVLNVAPNAQRGGIWMSGGAPAVDSSSNLYVLTGNGTFDATNASAPKNDYGDSLLQMSTALTVKQYFTPSDELKDAQNDEDFGAGGAAVLADLPAGSTVTHVLVCGGKDGTLYVINRDLLGGFGDGVAAQTIDLGYGIFTTSAIWNDYIFLAGIGGPLVGYQFDASIAQFKLASSSAHAYNFPGSTPSVSAASTTQGGLVWALDTNSFCTPRSTACGPAVLYAYDATNLATELWDSARVAADSAGNAIKFSVPTVANGRVYVGTRGNNTSAADSSSSIPGELEIYGLKP